MPLYEYFCPTCDNKFDKLQPMSATGAECPVCEQLITPPVMRCRKNHYLCSGCRDGLSPKR